MATFGFHAKGLVSEIQSKVAEMANIWSVSAFPPNCKVEFGDDLEENKAATFIVKLKDFQKKGPFKDGGLDVTDMKIIIKDPKGKCFLVDIILKLRIIEIFTKLKALVNDHCSLFKY